MPRWQQEAMEPSLEWRPRPLLAPKGACYFMPVFEMPEWLGHKVLICRLQVSRASKQKRINHCFVLKDFRMRIEANPLHDSGDGNRPGHASAGRSRST
jgi:hypothetical protein